MIYAALPLLEKAINQCLSCDPETCERLNTLDGKIIQLDMTDWNIAFYLLPTNDNLTLQESIEGEPDTIISGRLYDLFRVGLSDDKSTAMKEFPIKFSGDAHTGIAMQQILSQLDIDWEEQLAQLIGDVPASLLSKGLQSIRNFGKDITSSLKRNTHEYIFHEAKCIPTKQELGDFYRDVSTLRHDVDRLEAKIRRL